MKKHVFHIILMLFYRFSEPKTNHHRNVRLGRYGLRSQQKSAIICLSHLS